MPDDFEKILSVMRSRGVFVSIILQSIAQLKALFEKEYEIILSNCDEFLYLGGNDQFTQEYVSKMLGKETIDVSSSSKSTGRTGNYTTNRQVTGRELMTPDEIGKMDNRYAILSIRGEYPVMDLKYDITKNPYIDLTADGKADIYIHRKDNIRILESPATEEEKYSDFIVLSDDEL